MLNWYRVERVLGRGGFGVIYLATDTNLDHPVAIKEYIPPGSARRDGDTALHPLTSAHDGQYREGLGRFITEARNLVRFKHPNIVRVMSVFQKNNTAYMVMEFEEGENLNRYLARAGTRSERRLKSLIRPICEGLAEVHRHGFIHRDIKPANILVRPDGSPVLLDFGSARDASATNGEALTALVTVGYAPLEQYNDKNDEQQGPWTDIYALAGVLYYAISGGDPIDSARRGSALLNGGRDPLISAAAIGGSGYSEDFLAAIDWALSFRIADRPQTLSDWLPALLGRTSIREVRRDTPDIDALMDVSGGTVARGQSETVTSSEYPFGRANLSTERSDISASPGGRGSERSPVIRRSRVKRGWLRSLPGIVLAALIVGTSVLWALQKGPFSPESEVVSAEAVAKTPLPGRSRDSLESAALVAERSRQIERLAEIERREQALADRQIQADAAEAARAAELAARQQAESERASAAQEVDRAAKAAEAAAQRAAQRAAEREAETESRRDRLLQEARERRAKAAQELYVTSLAAAETAIAERDIDSANKALSEARRSGVSGARLGILEARLERVVAEIKRRITDAEFDRVVRRFDGLKRAIEAKDMAVIDALTAESEQNALFRQLMLNFESLHMEITGIRVRNADKSVTGNLRINRMVRENGDSAVPSSAFRDREMTSRLVDGEWSPIVW